MDIVTECLPELRYLLSLSKSQSRKYIQQASPMVIECLFQVALNLVYGSKARNGIEVSPAHLKTLKKHKRTLMKLIRTKKPSLQRKLLKGGAAVALLTVLASVIATLASLV